MANPKGLTSTRIMCSIKKPKGIVTINNKLLKMAIMFLHRVKYYTRYDAIKNNFLQNAKKTGRLNPVLEIHLFFK